MMMISMDFHSKKKILQDLPRIFKIGNCCHLIGWFGYCEVMEIPKLKANDSEFQELSSYINNKLIVVSAILLGLFSINHQ